ncbi:hypothetical protein FS842_003961, partial [Serendipita sp. 407]
MSGALTTTIDHLHELRIGLLKSESWLNKDGGVERGFQDKYNQIIEKIQSFKFPFRHDPLKYFPVEVWSPIIEESAAAYGSHGRETYYVDVGRLFKLSSVSTHWRRMLMSAPELWAHLLINDREDVMKRINLVTRLTGDHTPLHLHLVLPLNTWIKVSSTIQVQQGRIRSITVWNLQSYKDNLDPIASAARSFSSLPSLERVSWANGGLAPCRAKKSAIIHEFVRKSKNIRYLPRAFTEEQTLRLPNISQLRQVNLFNSPLQLFPFLLNLNQLEDVNIKGFKDQSKELAYFCEEDEADIPTTKPGQLRWKRLDYSCSPYYFGITLVKRVAASLEDLSLTTYLWMAPRFFSLLGSMERLRTLKIVIYLHHRDRPFKFHPHFRPSNIRSLTLGVFDVQAPQEQANDVEKLNLLEPLSHQLPNYIQSVKLLHVDTGKIPLAFASEFITRMVAVEELKIEFGGTEPFFDPPTLDQRPLWKKVSFSGPTFMFDLLQSPYLTDLVVEMETAVSLPHYQWHFSEDTQFSSILSPALMRKLFSAGEWPNLQSLQLQAGLCDWTNASHPSVTTLRLRATILDKRDYITQFCQQIALNPSNFPRLQHLELDWYPQWDILFLMLERRNFQCDAMPTSIEVLVLPSLTAPWLLETARFLVQGKIPQKP